MLEKDSNNNIDESSCGQSVEDLYVSYSVKVIEHLELIKKKHNEQNNSRINLSKLKSVFKAAGKNYDPSSNIDINIWCLARVNMYLEMTKGCKSYKNVDKQVFTLTGSEYDLTEGFLPTEQCFSSAEEYVKNNNLDLDFKDIDNLYLIDKNENGYSYFEF